MESSWNAGGEREVQEVGKDLYLCKETAEGSLVCSHIHNSWLHLRIDIGFSPFVHLLLFLLSLISTPDQSTHHLQPHATVPCDTLSNNHIQAERRRSASVTYSNQPADNLIDTPSSSVDVVISLQCAQRMQENGLDWKKSIREAGRVLKPGGRFLFVESVDVGGESYLEEVMKLSGMMDYDEEESLEGEDSNEDASEMGDDSSFGEDDDIEVTSPIFEEVGYDNVDMVLQPHIAGVALKAMDADLTSTQKKQMKSQEEEDRLAEMSLNAFERGNKKRKRKKTKKVAGFGGSEE
jgi:SAM-dependent methyltransferase